MMNTPDDSKPLSPAAAELQYRDMIQKVTRAIAEARIEDVLPYLGKQYEEKHVALFVDSNFDKRIDVLFRLMPFVSEDEDFPNFEDLAAEFADSAPIRAYEGSTEECDAMLAWLEETQNLTPRQQDTIVTQRARYGVEHLARDHRGLHVRFQELVTLAPKLVTQLSSNDQLTVHVNPIHCWAELNSDKYLDEGESPPVPAMYYADDDEVRTAMFEPFGKEKIEQLNAMAPCPFAQWAMVADDMDRDDLLAFAKGLADLHVIAFS